MATATAEGGIITTNEPDLQVFAGMSEGERQVFEEMRTADYQARLKEAQARILAKARAIHLGKYDVPMGAQPGAQEKFLSSPADIVFYGGAAGGGKTIALLLEALRHVGVPGYQGVIFRRTYPQVKNPGGLWDESTGIYPHVRGCKAQGNKSDLKWIFPARSAIKFAHMQREENKLEWMGSQVAFIGWDELTHFSESQFFYMLSRNRSTCGIRPYIRATMNPDADSWVAQFIEWYIGDDGYIIPERSGVIRYFIRDKGELIWADTRAELKEKYPKLIAKSFTFITATVFDNEILLAKNPDYLSNLMSLPLVERERLLGDSKRGGNWKIKPAAGKVFNRAWFEVKEAAPALPVLSKPEEIADYLKTRGWLPENLPEGVDPDSFFDKNSGLPYGAVLVNSGQGKPKAMFQLSAANIPVIPSGREVRFWDLADTAKKVAGDDPDYTVGLKLRQVGGEYYIMDVVRLRAESPTVDKTMLNTAIQDGYQCAVRWEIEPSASGKRNNRALMKLFAGFDAKGKRPVGDKALRAMPAARQAEAGNIKLLYSKEWNEPLLKELHNFPDDGHDDQVDALSGAFNELADPIAHARSYSGSKSSQSADDDRVSTSAEEIVQKRLKAAAKRAQAQMRAEAMRPKPGAGTGTSDNTSVIDEIIARSERVASATEKTFSSSNTAALDAPANEEQEQQKTPAATDRRSIRELLRKATPATKTKAAE